MIPVKHKKIFEDGKYVPQRMCISCRQILPKTKLIRVAGFKDGGVKVAETGGRGVYVCSDKSCMEKLLKSNGLSRGLKRNVPKEVYEECMTCE